MAKHFASHKASFFAVVLRKYERFQKQIDQFNIHICFSLFLSSFFFLQRGERHQRIRKPLLALRQQGDFDTPSLYNEMLIRLHTSQDYNTKHVWGMTTNIFNKRRGFRVSHFNEQFVNLLTTTEWARIQLPLPTQLKHLLFRSWEHFSFQRTVKTSRPWALPTANISTRHCSKCIPTKEPSRRIPRITVRKYSDRVCYY